MSYTSPILAEIDRKWIDVDFEQVANSEGRFLGCQPTPEELFASLREEGAYTDYEATGTMIPQSEWADRIKAMDANGGWLERRLVEIKDQNGEGSCVANATTTAHQIVQANSWGDEQVRILSAISVYRECAPGPNTGSNVGEVMRQQINVGALPSKSSQLALADVSAGRYATVHPDIGYSKRPPANWKETAKFFRVDEWWRLNSLEAVVSANLCGYPVVGARSRHCICFVRWILDGNNMFFVYANSWGTDWGSTFTTSVGPKRGFGLDSKSTVSGWVSREAWCPRTIIKPSWLT